MLFLNKTLILSGQDKGPVRMATKHVGALISGIIATYMGKRLWLSSFAPDGSLHEHVMALSGTIDVNVVVETDKRQVRVQGNPANVDKGLEGLAKLFNRQPKNVKAEFVRDKTARNEIAPASRLRNLYRHHIRDNKAQYRLCSGECGRLVVPFAVLADDEGVLPQDCTCEKCGTINCTLCWGSHEGDDCDME